MRLVYDCDTELIARMACFCRTRFTVKSWSYRLDLTTRSQSVYAVKRFIDANAPSDDNKTSGNVADQHPTLCSPVYDCLVDRTTFRRPRLRLI